MPRRLLAAALIVAAASSPGPPGQGPQLEEGLVIAIEPMVNIGGSDVYTLQDGWTVVTADQTFSAHFEDTVAVTKDGPEILTR